MADNSNNSQLGIDVYVDGIRLSGVTRVHIEKHMFSDRVSGMNSGDESGIPVGNATVELIVNTSAMVRMNSNIVIVRRTVNNNDRANIIGRRAIRNAVGGGGTLPQVAASALLGGTVLFMGVVSNRNERVMVAEDGGGVAYANSIYAEDLTKILTRYGLRTGMLEAKRKLKKDTDEKRQEAKKKKHTPPPAFVWQGLFRSILIPNGFVNTTVDIASDFEWVDRGEAIEAILKWYFQTEKGAQRFYGGVKAVDVADTLATLVTGGFVNKMLIQPRMTLRIEKGLDKILVRHLDEMLDLYATEGRTVWDVLANLQMYPFFDMFVTEDTGEFIFRKTQWNQKGINQLRNAEVIFDNECIEVARTANDKNLATEYRMSNDELTGLFAIRNIPYALTASGSRQFPTGVMNDLGKTSKIDAEGYENFPLSFAMLGEKNIAKFGSRPHGYQNTFNEDESKRRSVRLPYYDNDSAYGTGASTNPSYQTMTSYDEQAGAKTPYRYLYIVPTYSAIDKTIKANQEFWQKLINDAFLQNEKGTLEKISGTPTSIKLFLGLSQGIIKYYRSSLNRATVKIRAFRPTVLGTHVTLITPPNAGGLLTLAGNLTGGDPFSSLESHPNSSYSLVVKTYEAFRTADNRSEEVCNWTLFFGSRNQVGGI